MKTNKMVMAANSHQFRMHSKTERYVWATYHIFVFLSSLIGDSLILYASRKKEAFKLNKFIVILLQHIAISDLLFAIFSVLPSAISLLADSWVLGEVMCYVRVYSGHFFFPSGMFLIATLTTSKLILLNYPLWAANLTKRKAHVICCLVSAIAFSFPIFFALSQWNDIKFDYGTYTCDYMYKSQISMKLLPALVTLNLFAPIVVIVATTIPTIVYLAKANKSARRVKKSVPWQGGLAVTLTSVVCCLSNLPTIASHILKAAMKNQSDSSKTFRDFSRTAKFLLVINIMSNFYIYTLTIRSFRNYLKTGLLHFLALLRVGTGETTGEIHSKVLELIQKIAYFIVCSFLESK